MTRPRAAAWATAAAAMWRTKAMAMGRPRLSTPTPFLWWGLEPLG